MTPLLSVEGLRKSYGDRLAVDGISFRVSPGEVLGLLGPNGAGKSTTMMMVAGLLRADSGLIQFDGKSVDPKSPEYRRRLGVVPQDLAIYPELSARENLEFFGRLYGLRGNNLKDRIAKALSAAGLNERAASSVDSFSGGMKRRLNFGVALLHEPDLLILDEPTVGVDPQSRSHLLEGVRTLADQGLGVIYASHYMEEVQSSCNRVAIVDHGKLLVCDEISTLLGSVDTEVFMHVDGDVDKLANLPADARITHCNGAAKIVLRHDPGSQLSLGRTMNQILGQFTEHGVALTKLQTEEANLERLFLKLTGHSLRDG